MGLVINRRIRSDYRDIYP